MRHQRILGFDLAKTIAMFFVVLLHYAIYTRYYSNGVSGTLTTVLCVVCVPLFFEVNGALLLSRPLDIRKHYRKTLTIIIVVAIWKTIAVAYFAGVDGSHPLSAGEFVKSFIMFQLGGNFSEYPTGYFWFMNALIAIYLIYPAIKSVFDAGGAALRSVLMVLVVFTVGKDTLNVLLQMIGTASHHELTSMLGGLPEYYIFGGYGYVLLYFLTGGLLSRSMHNVANDNDVRIQFSMRWPFRLISPFGAVLLTGLCYFVLFGIQRFQHVANGTNLTVDYGYWLLPTYVATVFVLALCLCCSPKHQITYRIIECIGKNTWGVYMLHLIAITLFARLQSLPIFDAMSALPGVAVTALNLLFVVLIYLLCLAVSCIMRKIPVVDRLFLL